MQLVKDFFNDNINIGEKLTDVDNNEYKLICMSPYTCALLNEQTNIVVQNAIIGPLTLTNIINCVGMGLKSTKRSKYLAAGTILSARKEFVDMVVKLPNDKYTILNMENGYCSSIFDGNMCEYNGVTAAALLDYYGEQTYNILQYAKTWSDVKW